MNKKFLVLSLAVFVLAACAPAAGSGPYATNTLSVTGSSQVSVVPDVAYVSIGVRSESADVSQAVATNATEVDRVMRALQNAGINADDLQTTNFSVYGYDDYDFEGNPIGTIFNVENTVYVTVREISNMGDLLDSAVSAGANNIWGIQFAVEDRSSAVAEARSLAVEDAKQQGQALAEATGVTLGEISSVSFSTEGYSPYPVYGIGGGGGAAADSSTSIVPGQISVNVSVYLSYALK